MISVDNLAVEFGGSALFSEVSFTINENDKIALMGKNGAGKSTMMKIIAGEQKASRGHVRSHRVPRASSALPRGCGTWPGPTSNGRDNGRF